MSPLIEVLFNNTFTISRRVRVDDGQGGWSITYAEIGTVEGRMRPAGSAERIAADQESRRLTHVLYVLEGTDVARGDLVEGDGVAVELLGLREPSRADHHLEIDCEEKQAEEIPPPPRYYVDFNGATSKINCGTDASITDIPDNPFTVDAWIYPASAVGAQDIASKGITGGYGWWFEMSGVYPLTNLRGLAASDWTTADSHADTAIPLDTWHHVVMYLHDDLKIYLALGGTWLTYSTQIAMVEPYGGEGGNPLYLGYDGKLADAGFHFDGNMAWARISLGDRFGVGVNFTPPSRCVPPDKDATTIEVWPLDEGSGVTAAASVNTPANDGTMTDCIWGDCA